MAPIDAVELRQRFAGRARRRVAPAHGGTPVTAITASELKDRLARRAVVASRRRAEDWP